MALLIVSPVNIALNIILVHVSPLGLIGSPIALSITFWTAFGLLALLTSRSKKHRQNATWGGFCPSRVFRSTSCWTFFKLAVPGILMVGTEWLVCHLLNSTIH